MIENIASFTRNKTTNPTNSCENVLLEVRSSKADKYAPTASAENRKIEVFNEMNHFEEEYIIIGSSRI